MFKHKTYKKQPYTQSATRPRMYFNLFISSISFSIPEITTKEAEEEEKFDKHLPTCSFLSQMNNYSNDHISFPLSDTLHTQYKTIKAILEINEFA